MKTLFRLLRRLVVLVCIAAVLLMALPPLAREADRLLYPRKYSRQVEQWAAEYELDPLLVYAFIRTESGFDPAATSSVHRHLAIFCKETLPRNTPGKRRCRRRAFFRKNRQQHLKRFRIFSRKRIRRGSR